MDPGFELVKKRNIDISELHFQYLPSVFNVKFWAENENDITLVKNSPHVQFLQIYNNNSDNIWEIYKETKYYAMQKYWDSINFHKRDDKFIKSKITRIIELFKSIKKYGFDNKKGRVDILTQPIWESRYAEKIPEHINKNGLEIWHGHHRLACCFVLEIKNIPCSVYRDVWRGKKKCERLDKRLIKVINDKK